MNDPTTSRPQTVPHVVNDAVRDEQLSPNDAYALMSPLGIGFATTAKELHRAAIDAQAAGRLDPPRAKAWADLRNVEKRLTLDFTFAEVPRGELLASASLALELEPLPEPSIEALAQALPVPAIVEPGIVSRELPPVALNIWALAAELLEQDARPAFSLPDPETFINEVQEDAP